MIRTGLLADLTVVAPSQYGSFTEFGTRVLYEVSFFIVVTTIGIHLRLSNLELDEISTGLNLIFGIIIDTFSEVRIL